jgi:predicted AAA+ superfamily ATPase
MYKLRHIEGELRRMAHLFKVIIVTGARQVGKTTLLQHVFPHAKIITFDPNEDVYQARQDPAFFFQTQPKPLILDEIQYAPELLPTLKRLVDQDPGYGQYFLTGSHNLQVLKNVAESMAGRVGILNLTPLTTYEISESFSFDTDNEAHPALWLKEYLADPTSLPSKITGTTEQSAVSAIWRGGLPGTLHFPSKSLSRYFSGYFQTYIQRDIRTIADISDLTAFQQFVRIISALTGQEINNTHLGREADIDPRTARNWLRLLQHSYQWQEIVPYSKNAIKQVVSTKTKGYLNDTGLACFLLKIPEESSVLAHPARGALFETLVVNLITTMIHVLGDVAHIYYWRTRNDAEVDLILDHNGALYPIEIKMRATLSRKDLSGLRAFKEANKDKALIKTALVIYAGTECYWLDQETIALPWNAVCKDFAQ